MENVQQFTWADHIKELGITMKAERTASNPSMENDPKFPMDHWKCFFRNSNGRTMTVYFSMGLGHHGEAPEAADVLDCLASEAAGIENARNFEDWCSEYSYNTDSRKAEKVYKTCQKQAEKLKAFLEDLYSPALWETERLQVQS